MILQQEKIEVKRSEDFEEVQYGVNESNVSLLFQMLRSNLYSNVHGSILREYVSNCYDSHVEAGKPDEIIEVKLVRPITLQPGSLTFIDKGVGLSPERIQTIFSKYLSSTKRDDNEQIGGFGLGSKSLFAFTERFIITTIVDSIEYEYLAYIDETGLGKIALTRKEELKDNLPYNQTSIQAVLERDADYAAFISNLDQLKYFQNLKISVDDKEITETEVTTKQEFEAINNTAYNKPIAGVAYHRYLRLLVGSVCYYVPDHILTECFRNIGVTNSSSIRQFPMIKVPIGKVQLTMSREDINYVESTKSYISEVLKSWVSDSQKKYINWLESSNKYTKVEDFLIEGDPSEVIENLSILEASPSLLNKF
ncbi:MAG: ATP-binding protein, partial [Richelia sp. RM2_1_2]|nr:ATP-binding protein [Richelia sp. RM2_1_2]